MTFDEPGFEKVFNGRDFTGIRFVLGANCAPKPAGCGQTEVNRLGLSAERGRQAALAIPRST